MSVTLTAVSLRWYSVNLHTHILQQAQYQVCPASNNKLHILSVLECDLQPHPRHGVRCDGMKAYPLVCLWCKFERHLKIWTLTQ